MSITKLNMIVQYQDTHGTRVMQLNEYEAKKWLELGIEEPTILDVKKFFDFPDGKYKGRKMQVGKITFSPNGGMEEVYLPRRK